MVHTGYENFTLEELERKAEEESNMLAVELGRKYEARADERYEDGISKGWDAGHEEGYAEGKADGYAQGCKDEAGEQAAK